MAKNSPAQKVSGGNPMGKGKTEPTTSSRRGISGSGPGRGGVKDGEGKLPTTVGPRGTLGSGAK